MKATPETRASAKGLAICSGVDGTRPSTFFSSSYIMVVSPPICIVETTHPSAHQHRLRARHILLFITLMCLRRLSWEQIPNVFQGLIGRLTSARCPMTKLVVGRAQHDCRWRDNACS